MSAANDDRRQDAVSGGVTVTPQRPPGASTGRPFSGSGAAAGAVAANVDSNLSAISTGSASGDIALESTQIDRTQLTWGTVIGAGITAEVFKGSWRGKEVAIKCLNVKRSLPAQLKQETAFTREVAVIANTFHPNLVKFHGIAFEAQPYLLITEICNGGNCFEMLHQDDDLELPIEQMLKMCCDSASAMEYLHQHEPQIIHRDLKSLNLLLTAPLLSPSDVPLVKVSDFGLARMKDQDLEWEQLTIQAGTFHWMAPEVATGHYDESVDVYSFGMVLFEFVCLEIPFEDLEPNDVLKATMNGERPDMEAVPPTMPKVLVDLMERCWAHNPEKRPSFNYICKTLHDVGVTLALPNHF